MGIFWEDFLGEIFERNFLGGIFWEEFFVYIIKVSYLNMKGIDLFVTFSKSADYFGDCFGNSLGILWKFLGRQLLVT